MNATTFPLLSEQISPSELFELPAICASPGTKSIIFNDRGIEWNPRDWFLQPLGVEIALYLAIDPVQLVFGARILSEDTFTELTPPPLPGSYHEGLWEADVVELFLFDPEGSSYLEMNLAPNSAWWMMSFERYRERHGDFSPPRNVLSHSQRKLGGGGTPHVLQVALSIPLSTLQSLNLIPVNFSAGEAGSTLSLSGNFCAIFHKRYFSLAHPESEKPDFHRPRQTLLSSPFPTILRKVPSLV